ncbi:hypothetical protein GO495_03115 [Chitinophaga oryziterrae]|uniref:Copper-binding protein MbnP-like domain-containing protein n=1 Tax=Chitinophaga oryziterrae TaxID=1031224 RepID=A0A6N8J3R0_9BACT|nr:MbnP family protein [Chitinophaga oryziterrae]MVT39564.1 hypothetical protein [Chitinophaga oryziterrae]
MKHILLLSTVAALFLTSCSKDDNNAISTTELGGQTTLTFNSTVGTADFSLNKDFTINGSTYNFTQLRYWVSNISLINDKGGAYKVPNSYFLLEENNAIAVQDGSFTYPAHKREDVIINEIPAGTYKRITFSVGIDSIYNNNLSLQAGELSQLNGMTNISWMWHTSYIFSSLKGSMKVGVDSTAITVETGLNKNYRTLSIDFPASVNIGASAATAIKFNVDVAKVIDGLDLSTTPVIGAAQATQMTMVADNYSTKAIVASSTASK